MVLIDFLMETTGIIAVKFLKDKISEYRKSNGKSKDVEDLEKKLEFYKNKTTLAEKELEQIKDIALRLEGKLGGGYISDNAYVNWSLDKIKPERSAFNIDVWTEKGDYKVSRDILTVPKTETHRIGDKINIYFRSERDCYLTLINFGTSGKLTVLLPNALSKNNFIEAGKVYAIPGGDYPFDYQLTGPPGIERIKAIATIRKINLMHLAYNKGEVFRTSKSATRDISIMANDIESIGPNEWAEIICEIEVT